MLPKEGGIIQKYYNSRKYGQEESMNTVKKILALLCGLAFLAFFTACEDEGPMERTGKKVDEAVENTQEQMEEAGDKAQEQMEEVGDAMQDAADKVGEKMEEAGEKMQDN